MDLGEKIYTLRKKAGMSQEELAQRLGVTRQAVSKWELGTGQPELQSLAALAREFGVTTDYLLSEDEPAPQQEPASPAPGYPQWVDRLPGFLARMLRRWGWLAGVQLAIGGGGFCLLGLAGKAIVRQMVNSFNTSVDQMFGSFNTSVDQMTGSFGGFDSFFGTATDSMSQMVSANPVTMVCNLMIGIGLVLILAGTVIALLLRRWGKKS